MTKRRVTIDWQTARQLFEKGCSLRDIARKSGGSPSGIRRRAAAEKWRRPVHERAQRVHINPRPLANLHPLILEAATTDDPLALVRKGRHLIGALLDELMRETDAVPDMLDLASASDATKAKAIEKAVSLATRTQAAKNLATALTALTAQVGKKREAALAADRAGQDSEWGEDLLPYDASATRN